MDVVGRLLIGGIGIAALLALPLSEFARGMATNPSQHEMDRGSLVITLIGGVLLAVALLA